MIKIERNITYTYLNALYVELYNNNESQIDICLPLQIEKLGFGQLFSFVQFIATWVRNEKSGILYLPINEQAEVDDYLDGNEFVYPAIVLSWEKKILGVNKEDIKSFLKNPSKRYFEKMDFFELKGYSVPIYCFDHDKSNRGLSRHFYSNSRELVNEESLSFNFFRAFQKVGSYNFLNFRKSIKGQLESFISIIHELFANTHEHAKTNEFGFNLYPNIRAVHLKFHKRTINNLIQQSKEFPGLHNYFKSNFKLNEQGELYLLEISVLDSGPGIALRYSSNSQINNKILDVRDEVEIIKECLYRHNTSTEFVRGEIKGIGLDRVLQTLDGKGFIRIKTGRVDVFRDMKTVRYFHHENSSQIVLNDLQSNSASYFTEYPRSEGTMFSIFYPLENY